MKIPYDEISLKLAIMSLSTKIENKEIDLDELKNKLEKKLGAPVEGALLNKKIAEELGISVLGFINSPNYKTLKEEYEFNYLKKFVGHLEEFGLTNKESWAIVAQITGCLEC